MASNPIPFPPRAAAPAAKDRSSFLNPWKRRTTRQPVGVRLFDFPVTAMAGAAAPPRRAHVAVVHRPYLMSSQSAAGEGSRPRLPIDGLAQARRIAHQVEREIAAQAGRERTLSTPGERVLKAVPAAPAAQPDRPAPRSSARRFIQTLFSPTRTA